MAATEADYYELLGVSRSASDAEIKQSFRKLARELHPDVSDAPDADTRFREVAEAYEVLSDPERRALYDRYGKAGLERRGFEPAFVDFGSLTDVFAASSARTSWARRAPVRARRVAATSRPRSRSSSRRRSPGSA
jgi:DnaJ-class molecular chaperone